MNKNNLCIASFAFLLLIGQISAQDHLWTFDENKGTISYDKGTAATSGYPGNNGNNGNGRNRGGNHGNHGNPGQNNNNAVNAVLTNAGWWDLSKVGAGAAVTITGADNSYVSFGGNVGQFGTQDFTLALWFQTTDNSLPLADLIGNRASSGNGNFFDVRITNDGYVSAEVDQDASGTNYIGIRSTQKGLNDGKWHQIVVARNGRTLALYIDGALSNSGTANGVANINNKNTFKLGRSLVDRNTPRFAPKAVFDDVAIYSTALSASQVKSLYQGATNQ